MDDDDNNNVSHQQQQNPILNLKHLPPLNPSSVINPSFNRRWKPSNKFVKHNFNRGLKSFRPNPNPNSSGAHGKSTAESDSAENGTNKGPVRAHLFEICAANHWRPPVFECCKEEGPSHRRQFTFKVIVDIEAGQTTTLECFSSPHLRKKEAADHAAEGALWFLKHEGHVRKNKHRDKGL